MLIFNSLKPCVFAVLLLPYFVNGGSRLPVKSVEELTSFDRLFLKVFSPEHYKLVLNHNKASVHDDYSGYIEIANIELPFLMLQLNKFGNDFLFPSATFGFGIFGTVTYWNFIKPRVLNVDKTTIKASMNGRRFTVNFDVPDAMIDCPLCNMEDIDNNKNEYQIAKFYTLTIKNYSISVSVDVSLTQTGVYFSNAYVDMHVEKVLGKYENGTRIDSEGNESGIGELTRDWVLNFNEEWPEMQGSFERFIPFWLNCMASSIKDYECDIYRNERLHHQSLAELIHGYGLAALNKQRALSPPDDPEDPATTVSRILFDFTSHVIQTAKIASALEHWNEDRGTEEPLPSITGWYVRMTYNVTLDGVHEFVGLGGSDSDEITTNLSGTDFVNAHLETTNNTFSYKFSVEQLQLDSTDYRRVSTNLTTGNSKRYEGLNLLIASSSFSVSGNISAADDGTLGVSNVIVHMSPGEITMDIPKVSQCFGSGECEDLPAISQNAKQLIVDMWSSQIGSGDTLQKRYSQMIEDTMNDFLSGRVLL